MTTCLGCGETEGVDGGKIPLCSACKAKAQTRAVHYAKGDQDPVKPAIDRLREAYDEAMAAREFSKFGGVYDLPEDKVVALVPEVLQEYQQLRSLLVANGLLEEDGAKIEA